VPFIDTYEELTTTLQVKFLDYTKLVLEPPTGETVPTATEGRTADGNVHGSKQRKRGKRDLQSQDGCPIMPEVDDTDLKEDLEDLLRCFLTAQYSECVPDRIQIPCGQSGIDVY
jgi:hypothetical protein